MRNKTTLVLSAITFTAILFMSIHVSATAPSLCGKLVGKCTSESTTTRGSCFRKCAGIRECSGSPLRRLLAKRITYAPLRRRTERKPRSSIGSRSVEPLCLDYFDIQLRNAIDFGPINAERERALYAQLNRCSVRKPSPGVRPVAFDNSKYSDQ